MTQNTARVDTGVLQSAINQLETLHSNSDESSEHDPQAVKHTIRLLDDALPGNAADILDAPDVGPIERKITKQKNLDFDNSQYDCEALTDLISDFI